MSIVEKAAERLKALQPEPVLLADGPAPLPTGPTIERLRDRTRGSDQADAVEAAPTPALHIDPHVLRRAGLLPFDDDAGALLADEVRRVKRPLLDNAYGKGGKPLAHAERIAVASAVPGEGKTFTAVNLALSLAREPDFEVLLVDGDIPKMDITRVLGLEEHQGLMDALTGACQPESVIVTTDVPNLLVVPAGQRSAVTTELFGGRRMEYVVDRFGGNGRQRLLVFDSSPLLVTPESQVLTAHMGQIVMVVRAGHTRQHELKSALECMHDDAQYVGIVLNMSRLPAIESHHYPHYSYYTQHQPQGH